MVKAPTLSTNIDCKVVVDLPRLPGLNPQNDLLGTGYSFGATGYPLEVQKSQGSIRCETKMCYLATLTPSNLYVVMSKQKLRKEEKMLSIVRSLPYFKGVTRNTAMKIAGLFVKHKPCLNQVLIKQGDKIDQDVIIIIHKG